MGKPNAPGYRTDQQNIAIIHKHLLFRYPGAFDFPIFDSTSANMSAVVLTPPFSADRFSTGIPSPFSQQIVHRFSRRCGPRVLLPNIHAEHHSFMRRPNLLLLYGYP